MCKISKVLIFVGLILLTIVFYRSASAETCWGSTLANVSGNRPVVGVFMGDAARDLVLKLDKRQIRDWANVKVKVVTGGSHGYVHVLVIESNCVVSIMSRTLETYQAAVK